MFLLIHHVKKKKIKKKSLQTLYSFLLIEEFKIFIFVASIFFFSKEIWQREKKQGVDNYTIPTTTSYLKSLSVYVIITHEYKVAFFLFFKCCKLIPQCTKRKCTLKDTRVTSWPTMFRVKMLIQEVKKFFVKISVFYDAAVLLHTWQVRQIP